jgi:hypothetical protein
MDQTEKRGPDAENVEAETQTMDEDIESSSSASNGKGNAGGRPTPLTIAEDLKARGYKPIPVPVGKNPNYKKWQSIETRDNLPHFFKSDKLNVGAQMGPVSGGLTDVDLDCAEAMKLAPYFLPRTGSVYGRASKPRSHYLYKINDSGPKASTELNDENNNVIVELRLGGGGKGAQSVMPGSLHPSGETYEWDEDDEPVKSAYATLYAAIVKIAVATLFVRHWPEKNRHDASMQVGGLLARAMWQPNDIGEFMVAVQEVACVSDPTHVEGGRKAAVNVAKAYFRDGTGYGLPAVGEFFGENVAKRIAKLLGYREARSLALPGEPEWRECNDNGMPVKSLHNARLAIAALGVECRYDLFHDKFLIGYQGDKVQHEIIIGEYNDNALLRLRQMASDRFGFDLSSTHSTMPSGRSASNIASTRCSTSSKRRSAIGMGYRGSTIGS